MIVQSDAILEYQEGSGSKTTRNDNTDHGNKESGGAQAVAEREYHNLDEVPMEKTLAIQSADRSSVEEGGDDVGGE